MIYLEKFKRSPIWPISIIVCFFASLLFLISEFSEYKRTMDYVEYPRLSEALAENPSIKSFEITAIEYRLVEKKNNFEHISKIESPFCGGDYHIESSSDFYFMAYMDGGTWRVFSPKRLMDKHRPAEGESIFRMQLDLILAGCAKRASW